MLIFGIIAALICVVVAFMLGEKSGDATGYQRGTFDGHAQAMNATLGISTVTSAPLTPTAHKVIAENSAQLDTLILDSDPNDVKTATVRKIKGKRSRSRRK